MSADSYAERASNDVHPISTLEFTDNEENRRKKHNNKIGD